MLLAAFQMRDVPARQAFVVEMGGEEDLGNAIALNSSLFNFARIELETIAKVIATSTGKPVEEVLAAMHDRSAGPSCAPPAVSPPG